MAFIIICDDRRVAGHVMALADRSSWLKAQKIGWWTKNPKQARSYHKLQTAEEVCGRLKYNNPRVVGFAEGVKMLQAQNETDLS